jgi:hypothetical protein
MKRGFPHNVKCNLFADSFFSDLGNGLFGQVCIHISAITRHLGLWTKPAIEFTNIGQFQMHPLKGNLHMAEEFLFHFSVLPLSNE